jgi:hypothetical protein
MNNEIRTYKDHWIRCVALPQTDPVGFWECAVYVFVSMPLNDREPSDDTCLRAVLRNLLSEAGALLTGLSHARDVIDRRLQNEHDLWPTP